MIPNTSSLVAVFKERAANGAEYEFRREIVAWADDGHALIAPQDRSGALRAVSSLANFLRIEEDDRGTHSPYVQVIPGGGWMVRQRSEEGVAEEPVVAWGFTADGFGHALISSGNGLIVRGESIGDEDLYHPSETWQDAKAHGFTDLLRQAES